MVFLSNKGRRDASRRPLLRELSLVPEIEVGVLTFTDAMRRGGGYGIRFVNRADDHRAQQSKVASVHRRGDKALKVSNSNGAVEIEFVTE